MYYMVSLFVMIIISVITGEDQRNKFILEISSGNQKTLHLQKKDIYNDLIKLCSEQAEIVLEYPLLIKFMDEIAIDAGGVSRDFIFSRF